MMRDEVDVAAGVVEHLATEGVDGFIIADNRSVDGTGEMLRQLGLDLGIEIYVIDDPEVGYYQSRKMSELAEQAYGKGAEWIIPFDADEIWVGVAALRYAQPDVVVADARLHDHFVTAADTTVGRTFERMVYRRESPASLYKVAPRWRPGTTIHQGNHGCSLDGERLGGVLAVHHFPYRSAEHFITKARNGAEAYAATDLPRSTGQHWREYGEALESGGAEALAGHWRRHFFYEDPVASGMIFDPIKMGRL